MKERMQQIKKPKLFDKKNSRISSEYHQEKAEFSRRAETKCRTTQDPQDRMRIFQYQVGLNESAIQEICEE
jgi:hypothetical protein